MKKILLGLVIGLMLFAAPSFAKDDPKPALRIVTSITDKDAVGTLFLNEVTQDLTKGIDAQVTRGDELDTNDASGPELRVATLKIDGSDKEAVVAVLTYHKQGQDEPPIYLAVAAGVLSADSANSGADEVARMIVVETGGYEEHESTKPQPQQKKQAPTSLETAIMKIRVMAHS